MKTKTNETAIRDHYRQADLEANIRKAFNSTGRKIKDYTDTESMDEFHIRGREATRELAQLADLQKGMRVLDLGCGVGGPARVLAAEFGCVVTGIDLVEEYCQAAAMLTERTGLSHMVDFQQGDMTALVFNDQSFDAAWTLHTIMNIEDKTRLFDSVLRILKPGGLFVLYEICAGTNLPPYFPVPWAGDASMSFLLSPDELRRSLKGTGFKELQWVDVSHVSVKWFQGIARSRAESTQMPGGGCSGRKGLRPGISLLMGKTAAEKSGNVFRNLSGDRIRTVFGVFQRPESA
ncbi:MAG: methyltransferase domain-containing protein [Desulfobacteraceae bacterium]|nr:methyltransferase domain-containing protein [Desulfobacteraceae bacterium]MBC2754586.1 methyltransferase domain-containing protein [Desulfobacteraceae bacterium]